jgi:hypothetical protein
MELDPQPQYWESGEQDAIAVISVSSPVESVVKEVLYSSNCAPIPRKFESVLVAQVLLALFSSLLGVAFFILAYRQKGNANFW